MIVDYNEITTSIAAFYWSLTRIAGVLAIAPVIGSTDVPIRIRVGLALILAVALSGYTGAVPNVDPLSLAGVLVTINQIIIGVFIGFVVLIVFNAFLIAGEAIAATMGLGFAMMSDPRSGVQVPVLSQFFSLIATLVFLALDGHHMVIRVLVDSFEYIPITSGLSVHGYWDLIQWSAVLFKGAVLIALPALITMLAVNIIMGVMTRSAPQLNIFSVGFPITMTVGFVIVMITLPQFVASFAYLFNQSVVTLTDLLAVFGS